MDSAKLETFLYVCKEQSFTKAAEKLFITPAAVKKQIDVLEDEVGTQLVHRSPAGCTLTVAGEVFQEQARAILKLVNDAIERTRRAEKEQVRELRVGHSVKFNYGFITDIMGEYQERYPDHSVHMERIKKTELPNALQKQLIDCFLYINPQRTDFPGIASEPVGTTRIHAVVRRHHPYAQKELITRADLEGYEVYLSAVLDQALYDELAGVLGSNLHILDTTDRNDLMTSQQRNAIFLYPCPTAYNISIPFDYPSMDIRLFYDRKNPAVSQFEESVQAFFAQEQNRVII